MGSHSDTYRASNVLSTGTNWNNVAHCFDDPDNLSYAYRNAAGTSAFHINGFGINLPADALVSSVEVHSEVYLSTTNGYLSIYLYDDASSTSVIYTKVADGEKLSQQTVTQTYSASTLVEKLNEKGLYDGDLVDFINNVRVRVVGGSVSSSRSVNCYVYDNYLVVNYTIPDYTITVNASTGGTVTGGGTYESGSTATLTATPSTGYKFKQWSDGDTSATRTVTVTGNATYTAEFEKVTVTISASADPSEGGFVTGTGSYQYGDTFTLTAVPNDGYKFVRWSTWASSPSITRTASYVDEGFVAYFEKTGNIYVGSQRVAVYCGTQQMSVYCGTKKLS